MFSMSSLLDFRSLVIRLSREFAARDMQRHLESLRHFYKQHLKEPISPKIWTIDLVVEWLALMQIEPFHRTYMIQPPRSPCPRCAQRETRGSPSLWTEIAWPGGAKMHCRCGAVWVELETPRR